MTHPAIFIPVAINLISQIEVQKELCRKVKLISQAILNMMLKADLEMFQDFWIRRFQNQLISKRKKVISIVTNRPTLMKAVIIRLNTLLSIDLFASVLDDFKEEVQGVNPLSSFRRGIIWELLSNHPKSLSSVLQIASSHLNLFRFIMKVSTTGVVFDILTHLCNPIFKSIVIAFSIILWRLGQLEGLSMRGHRVGSCKAGRSSGRLLASMSNLRVLSIDHIVPFMNCIDDGLIGLLFSNHSRSGGGRINRDCKLSGSRGWMRRIESRACKVLFHKISTLGVGQGWAVGFSPLQQQGPCQLTERSSWRLIRHACEGGLGWTGDSKFKKVCKVVGVSNLRQENVGCGIWTGRILWPSYSPQEGIEAPEMRLQSHNDDKRWGGECVNSVKTFHFLAEAPNRMEKLMFQHPIVIPVQSSFLRRRWIIYEQAMTPEGITACQQCWFCLLECCYHMWFQNNELCVFYEVKNLLYARSELPVVRRTLNYVHKACETTKHHPKTAYSEAHYTWPTFQKHRPKTAHSEAHYAWPTFQKHHQKPPIRKPTTRGQPSKNITKNRLFGSPLRVATTFQKHHQKPPIRKPTTCGQNLPKTSPKTAHSEAHYVWPKRFQNVTQNRQFGSPLRVAKTLPKRRPKPPIRKPTTCGQNASKTSPKTANSEAHYVWPKRFQNVAQNRQFGSPLHVAKTLSKRRPKPPIQKPTMCGQNTSKTSPKTANLEAHKRSIW